MLFNKEISRTEMYFINTLEAQFNITRVRAKVILDYLMNKELNEMYRFVKNRQGYSIHLNRENDIFYINTPRLWFKFDENVKISSILNFMNQHLKQVN